MAALTALLSQGIIFHHEVHMSDEKFIFYDVESYNLLIKAVRKEEAFRKENGIEFATGDVVSIADKSKALIANFAYLEEGEGHWVARHSGERVKPLKRILSGPMQWLSKVRIATDFPDIPDDPE